MVAYDLDAVHLIPLARWMCVGVASGLNAHRVAL